MRYLLDTNICVDWLRGKRQTAEAIEQHGLRNCCISEITKAELLFGVELAHNKGVRKDIFMDKFFSSLELIPISRALELYAIEKARLNSIGTPIEDFDLLIGCTAVEHGMVLVSRNISHMSRIQGIRIESWGECQLQSYQTSF
ncbi:MAG: PIN domain-containing protein [Bacteroidales bacterium]|nr:PIN domain-containing protein [Bacteroidales bacterium]